MSSTPTKTTMKVKTSLRRKSRKCGRRTSRSTRHTCKERTPKSSLSNNAKVSEKLEALKNLIPAATDKNNGSVVKAEELFQKTADYIVLLKTQVLVLQKLIEFYGSSGKESSNENNLVSS